MQGLDWDAVPSEELCAQWEQYRLELPCLAQICIPRRIIPKDCLSCELHGFCDTSIVGYAAVVYFRIQCKDGSVNIFLICAESKVSLFPAWSCVAHYYYQN